MSYSQADFRTQITPPEACQTCRRVVHTISPEQIHRWTCNRGLHMQQTCTAHEALPNGRKADPAQTPPHKDF